MAVTSLNFFLPDSNSKNELSTVLKSNGNRNVLWLVIPFESKIDAMPVQAIDKIFFPNEMK